MAPSRLDPTQQTVHYQPCSPGVENSIEKNWNDIGTNELLEPELKLADFLKSAATARPSVNMDDLAQYTKWTEEFGQDG